MEILFSARPVISEPGNTASNPATVITAVADADKPRPSTQVSLSPAATRFQIDKPPEQLQARFSNEDERNAHIADQISKIKTFAQWQSGRYSHESEEDLRLSQLSMHELLVEGHKAAYRPENSRGIIAVSGPDGTVQGDKIELAMANLMADSRYRIKESSQATAESLDHFKARMQELEPGIATDSYDIVFKDGQVQAVGSGREPADADALEKIQALLDDPDGEQAAKSLLSNIQSLNTDIHHNFDLKLTRAIGYPPPVNNYLPDSLSTAQLMEGFSYSKDDSLQYALDRLEDLRLAAGTQARADMANGTYILFSSDGSTLSGA